MRAKGKTAVTGSLQVAEHPLCSLPVNVRRIGHEPCECGDNEGHIRSGADGGIHERPDALWIRPMPHLAALVLVRY